MRRRSFLHLAAGLPLAAASIAHAQQPSPTFVLIHGAWHGAWCWTRVEPLLQAQGHRVQVPTLPASASASRNSARRSRSTLTSTTSSTCSTRGTFRTSCWSGIPMPAPSSRRRRPRARRLRRQVFLDAVILGERPAPGPAGRARSALAGGRAAAAGPVLAFPTPPIWRGCSAITPHPAGTFEPPLILQNPLANGVPRLTSPATSRLRWRTPRRAAGAKSIRSRDCRPGHRPRCDGDRARPLADMLAQIAA